MKQTTHEFTILVDTREQKPLTFPATFQVAPATTCVLKTKKQKLDFGDYALEGFETLAAVERKGSIQELLKNFTDPDDGKRQGRALSRLVNGTRFPIFLVETPLSDLTRKLPSGEQPTIIFGGIGLALTRIGQFSIIFSSSLSSLSSRQTTGQLVAALLCGIAIANPTKSKKGVDTPVEIRYNPSGTN